MCERGGEGEMWEVSEGRVEGVGVGGGGGGRLEGGGRWRGGRWRGVGGCFFSSV
jgi:hypothetical protein